MPRRRSVHVEVQADTGNVPLRLEIGLENRGDRHATRQESLGIELLLAEIVEEILEFERPSPDAITDAGTRGPADFDLGFAVTRGEARGRQMERIAEFDLTDGQPTRREQEPISGGERLG